LSATLNRPNAKLDHWKSTALQQAIERKAAWSIEQGTEQEQ
jgi:hypothetical protein